MAWLYKRGKTWWLGYFLHGHRNRVSTKKKDIAEAEAFKATFEAMEAAQQAQRLNEQMFCNLTGKSMPMTMLCWAVKRWLEECGLSCSKSTNARYQEVFKPFLKFLKADDRGPLVRDVTSEMVMDYLNGIAPTRAPATVRLAKHVMSVFFRRAVAMKWCQENPVANIKTAPLRRQDRVRRGYSRDELLLVMRQAAHNPFWHFMCNGAYFSGLRLGDLAMLKKTDFSWSPPELRLITKKTDTPVRIPLAPAFAGIAQQACNNATKLGNLDGYLWPKQAALYQKYGPGPLSTQFRKLILIPIGLSPAFRREANAQQPRQRTALSFHSFRHTFVSQLKAAGASQAAAKALAGHANDAVSDLYTAVSVAELRAAIEALPVII